MQAQERAQAVYPVDHNGLSPTTGRAPAVGDIVYIDSHLDFDAGMEVMYWRDIRAVFNDAVHVRHNSRTLDFLKGVDGNTLTPLRVAALPRAVMEIVVDTPLNPPAARVQSKVVTPLAPRSAPSTAMLRRPPPVTPFIVPRPPVLPAGQQTPRPTARSIMGRIVPHINLVLLQEKGEGSQQDFLKALECYLKAVKNGHAYAQFAVGKLYFDGNDIAHDSHSMGIIQDHTKAREWFTKAANLGDAGAQNEIGVLYTQGYGVTQDYKKALEWLRKAADQGHANAQANIGMLSTQSRIQAILTQTCELHGYPIPRLFIILPKDTSERNSANHLANQFQLYFLCECGGHAKVLSDDNTSIPNHIHIAKHEGYDLQRPSKFFQKYGRYMLTLLEMIKYGSTSTSYFVPALSSVNVSGAIEVLTNSRDTVTPLAINQSIEYLQTLLSEQDAAKDSSTNSFDGQEALEGIDLCQLKAFIKSKDQYRAFGDLYRTITEEGHVKWICINHLHLAYKEQDQPALVAAVELNGGHYDPHLGRVTVSLASIIQAAGFFEVLAKAGHVDELVVTFDWEGTTSDLEAFGDILENAAVSILRLDFQRFPTSLVNKVQSTYIQQALARCINLPSLKMIHIVLPMDLFELSSLQPERLSFPAKLSFEVVSSQGGSEFGMEQLKRLADILKANVTLTILNLNNNSIEENGAVVLSEAIKTNSTLITLNLTTNSIGENGTVALSEALKTNSTLITLSLAFNSIGDSGAAALSEALRINSTLITLNLAFNAIGENGAVALSEALKTNSTLISLNLKSNSIGENGAVALSEALKINSTLISLNLKSNSIGENGAVALSEVLKINSVRISI
ncbi:hypothetical protein BGZ95_007167 [Linnemannia exigua]|uniref:RNI-like protein n=1 Tax=Linnemannia exigua TaxID=604196 RepID=A0AAD4DFU6_9FUNG|nr:hypothetical protein BGZ95_007167 [Linnemannia exigua]